MRAEQVAVERIVLHLLGREEVEIADKAGVLHQRQLGCPRVARHPTVADEFVDRIVQYLRTYPTYDLRTVGREQEAAFHPGGGGYAIQHVRPKLWQYGGLVDIADQFVERTRGGSKHGLSLIHISE